MPGRACYRRISAGGHRSARRSHAGTLAAVRWVTATRTRPHQSDAPPAAPPVGGQSPPPPSHAPPVACSACGSACGSACRLAEPASSPRMLRLRLRPSASRARLLPRMLRLRLRPSAGRARLLPRMLRLRLRPSAGRARLLPLAPGASGLRRHGARTWAHQDTRPPPATMPPGGGRCVRLRPAGRAWTPVRPAPRRRRPPPGGGGRPCPGGRGGRRGATGEPHRGP